MKYQIIAVLLCITTSLSFAQQKLPPDLEKYINKVLQTFSVPGVAVSIVQNGNVLLAKGYGTKKLGTNDPVDENTLFLIASNTKAFTTTALAILVQEKKIKWDDKVIDHLPWFRMSDDYVTTHMTIRDLLVHHSGLPAYAGDALLFPPSSYTRKEIIMKLPEIPLVHDFRTVYAYDNILYVTAGELIATVSGMPWEDFIKTRIFDVVGMKESISRFSTLKDKKNVSASHRKYKEKVEVVENFQQQDVGDAGDPAGGICSSAGDMAKWLITQLDSGRTPSKVRIFTPAATRELWKIVRPMPISKVDSLLKPAQQDFWGYSLGFRSYNYKQYKIVGHGGALRGFVSQIAMVPELNLGISVLTNQQSAAAYWSIIYHILDYYMQNKPFDWLGGYKRIQDSSRARSLEREKTSAAKKGIIQPASIAPEKFEGLYKDPLLGDITLKKESTGLVMRFANAPMFIADVKYYQYNTFIAKFRELGQPAEAFLSFNLNPDGTVNGATLKVKDHEESALDFDDMILKPVKVVKQDVTQLRKSILAEFDSHPEGYFAVAFKDLSTGKQFFINEHETFHAASTMKTPILIETYKLAAAGKLRITDSILVKNQFRSIYDGSNYSPDSTDDSEHDLYTKIGTKLTIFDMLHLMITMSSNLATNNMVELVGAKNANATMRSLGAKDMLVLRGVEDDKAFDRGMNNTTTAYDLMLVMESLALGKAVSKEASDAMIKIMFDQHFTDKIAKNLPTGVKVASKSGSLAGVSHDSGIVFMPDGRKYVVVLLSRGVLSYDDVNKTLANVSKLIYDYLE
jgi:CubicO group peptidase (beta-lactamase class C family)/beta-lactamase class A